VAVKVGRIRQLGPCLADQITGAFRLPGTLLEQVAREGFGMFATAGLMTLESLVMTGAWRAHFFS
jgi:hypothetical protein